MKLNVASLGDCKAFEECGISVPKFDVSTMQREGIKNPKWLHFGPGNIFRAFPARMAMEMLEEGCCWPITTIETYGDDSRRQLVPFDLMSLAVTLHPDGTMSKRVIAGVCENLVSADSDNLKRLGEVFTTASMTIVSFTITEKGYVIDGARGYLPVVQTVIDNGPSFDVANAMALLASLLWLRYQRNAAPLTLLSMDNFSHNGDKLRDSIMRIAVAWQQKGFVTDAFIEWINDRSKVAFPISVIDKITPRPSKIVAEQITAMGFEDMQIDTSGSVALAGFVNTESPEYLIIEDAFAANTPRPPFEDYGAKIVAREVCDKFETMKVTTCLNPLHTALALSGCLLRYETIDSALADPVLNSMIRRLGWEESMPVVVNPGIVAPQEFLREVIDVRLANPYLPDEPSRIAMDTSQKLGIRFGHTLKSYIQQGRSLDDLIVIPLVYALWMRYLLAVDDTGKPMELASDPLRDEFQQKLKNITLGFTDRELVVAVVKEILSEEKVFGIDVNKTPLGEKVIDYFFRMISGPGAVKHVLINEIVSVTE